MAPKITVSPDSPFTVDNIPFGVIKTTEDPTARCATAIGDFAIDLVKYAQAGRLDALQGNESFVEIFAQVSMYFPSLLDYSAVGWY